MEGGNDFSQPESSLGLAQGTGTHGTPEHFLSKECGREGRGYEESRGSQRLGVCSEHGLGFSANHLYSGGIARQLITILKYVRY